ncbi:hypothetical protein QTI05_22825 [Variovorax sp. J22R193]|uniref:hypothetical protein n=1 Tax=Variovorax fucosicus TaxID=3053517 RepID=UPI0025768C5E|nr:hypothetical protein [Variovorax sp. J22R193]MDM0041893.1 hypothetical protein [Variovorax sp. J22R193]
MLGRWREMLRRLYPEVIQVSYPAAMEVEYFAWMLPPDAWRKKPQRSPFKMTAEEAQARYPGATPIPETREVRDVGDGKPFAAGQPYQR